MTIDINSTTWAAIKAHADKQIERALKQIEVTGLSQDETENLRGQIKALRGVLAMGVPAKQFTTTDPLYS